MKTEYQYIRFELASRYDAKTKLWACKNRKSDSLLGAVEWDAGWRQYVFMSAPDCIFSAGCLKDIAHFIEQVTSEHKQTTQQRRETKEIHLNTQV